MTSVKPTNTNYNELLYPSSCPDNNCHGRRFERHLLHLFFCRDTYTVSTRRASTSLGFQETTPLPASPQLWPMVLWPMVLWPMVLPRSRLAPRRPQRTMPHCASARASSRRPHRHLRTARAAMQPRAKAPTRRSSSLLCVAGRACDASVKFEFGTRPGVPLGGWQVFS